ncbi:MAG: excinuclease ABC subunit UvrB [Planctomycetota bacterium]|nr:MAG: excinuclease ABC subunit UvrB [Planctomycetota bacterium]
MSLFRLHSDFKLKGDQPQAVRKLVSGIQKGKRDQVLLGVTGSGKTFTMANVIAQVQKPTLVIVHNKTLAVQLFTEFRELFPENCVEFFVSYYDYYQPEAYVPRTDTYIEKKSTLNEKIDKLRHRATRSILERRDVIIVASVSCIYGLGSPDIYSNLCVYLEGGAEMDRDDLLESLARIQYSRNDYQLKRNVFRVRGDIVDIIPSHEERIAIRILFYGDTIEKIQEIDSVTGEVIRNMENVAIYPGSHFVVPYVQLQQAIQAIEEELEERLAELESQGKLLEAQRLRERTNYDLDLLRETGMCHGIENYSRHLTGRKPGEPPPTLLDYFPKDSLFIIDESHVTIPQLRGMFHGDQSRKRTLVEYGFRLPSALDNRPLNFEEFNARIPQVIYVSATPSDYELELVKGKVVEQIVRPTGLMDPEIEIRPVDSQVQDLLEEIHKAVAKEQRVLVTTLTKKMAEDLTDYYQEQGIRVRYLHSDIDTVERAEIIRDLRKGEFDVLVGINLLREGLDLPEVALVAILEADKEGFLRSRTSLIQTCGRAARNLHGRVIMYADQITKSMQEAIDETNRRRKIQHQYNLKHGITPTTIQKKIHETLKSIYEADYVDIGEVKEETEEYLPLEKLEERIEELQVKMKLAAKELRFEEAIQLRDEILKLEKQKLVLEK